ncbi:MarR family winged helix-turn-helix transcriptional regulator [Oceaniglobus indicus]|uniref:MarR family winged helix-turn-helix transcriptional regulator n=1 Tax=Oceaniglobus indicus TaxID=2047749 RepID=UPI000C17A642|nr:MarR family transcriptional regulator [Oceaniglobus indicus]
MTNNGVDTDHIAFLVGDLSRLFRATFEKLTLEHDLGVTTAEARVLGYMSLYGPQRQSCLADLLGVAPMSLSVFLDRLETAGLVRRAPDPGDRRAKIVSLTRASEPVLRQIAGIGQGLNDAALAGIEPAAQAAFIETARQVRRNLESLRGPRTPGGRS